MGLLLNRSPNTPWPFEMGPLPPNQAVLEQLLSPRGDALPVESLHNVAFVSRTFGNLGDNKTWLGQERESVFFLLEAAGDISVRQQWGSG